MVQNGCSPHRLEQLLKDRLSPNQLRETLAHLDLCCSCRTTLESLAADQRVWHDLPGLLRQDEHDPLVPLSGNSHVGTLRPETASEPLPVLAVLKDLPPSDNPAALGRLGEYDILAVLGSGGMGHVLKGHDRRLRRDVAIKVLAPDLAANAAARRRFAREVRAAAAVVHPNVVEVLAVEEAATPPYFVMELVAGRSLADRIDSEGQLDLRSTLRIGMQAAQGLAAAHEQGLVHRDVKPSNILLQHNVDRVLLADFGLARAASDERLTCNGAVAGTPHYMSPEQANDGEIDHRSDLFSLGSVIYSMCAGESPFRANATMDVLRRICDRPHRDVRHLNPDVPGWLVAIIDRLLAKRPARRFQSANEVAAELGAKLAQLQRGEVPASGNNTGSRLLKPFRQVRRWLAGGA